MKGPSKRYKRHYAVVKPGETKYIVSLGYGYVSKDITWCSVPRKKASWFNKEDAKKIAGHIKHHFKINAIVEIYED
jgi:hypothetical protein